MGGANSRPIILSLERERQHFAAFKIAFGEQRQRAKSSSVLVHTAQTLTRDRQRLQSARSPEEEELIAVQQLNEMKEQTNFLLLGNLLLFLSTVLAFPFFQTNVLAVGTSGLLGLTGSVLFVKAAWPNSTNALHTPGSITAQEISGWGNTLCFFLMVVACPVYLLDVTASMEIFMCTAFGFTLTGLVDTAVWFEQKRVAGFKDLPVFDVFLTVAEFLPFLMLTIGNLVFCWDMVYWLPNWSKKYTDEAFLLMAVGMGFYLAASVQSWLLVHLQPQIQHLRQHFMLKEKNQTSQLAPLRAPASNYTTAMRQQTTPHRRKFSELV